MAIIKCKMCGGDLEILPGSTVAECEYCGSRQTVPAVDDEKKLTLFARANRLRAACEFDKAAGIYESIVADFPEEAEAYWGLVLCKYGIEYVDDPATGKKIPTCHRSSFDSVMDDPNFEQAMENTDEVALRVFRDEAKQIEEIRKGILAVSSNERPYDIFICYKETDSKGERTVDSLLAQDIYDVLTDKGYRVFFSRITLEDKLGQAYEPYIFAALNSAKIMLAVGTCYEHYNAVWVKNEWNRYIKIIAHDKTKYLIPCYKGIDAYDIPKEFAHLQAQDLGKVGAMQDLLRGIEKILPRQQENINVTQEKVVVGGSGDNKIAALLDRGNMALEDGDWAKADSFFEDVLNSDAKNAQAYLGKTLAMEKCRTIDAFIRKRKDFTVAGKNERLYLQPKTAHIDQMVAKYTIPGYVAQNAIRELYAFDLGYSSEVATRRQRYHAEQVYWQNHQWLSRAEKFAAGAVAENLAAEKKSLFAFLADRVKKAEEAEAAAKARVQSAYDAHIAKADAQAAQRYENGLKRKDAYYLSLLQIAKHETDVRKLKDNANALAALGDYKDSKNLVQHCCKRAEEEQAKLDAEAERRRILREKQAKARKARNKRIAIILCVLLVLAFAVTLFVTQYLIPSNAYAEAEALMEAGKYDEAIAAFTELGDFSNSKEMIKECNYRRAMEWVADQNYAGATDSFETVLKGYKNSEGMLKAIEGLRLVRNEENDRGIEAILSGNVPVEIHYDTNGGQQLDVVTVTELAQYTGLATPVNTGYRFAGWKLTQCQYVANDKVVLTFEAQWTDGFLIHYELNGGAATNPEEYRKGGESVTLMRPTKLGYTFLGWTGTDLEDLTLDVTIPAGSFGNREYTAHWQANTYIITLNPIGGDLENTTITVTYDAAFTLPVPTLDQYTFAGWYYGNVLVSDGVWNRTENITLTARWEEVQYKITYNLDGGTNSSKNPSGFTVSTKEIALSDPSKAGYKFLGWYTDSGFKNKVTKISPKAGEDVTLYAKWEMETYTVTYHLDGGTNASGNVTSYTIQSNKITLADPTRSGYTFAGWYTDSSYSKKITAIDKGSYGDLDLYAKWEAIQYKITYNLDGGTNSSKNPPGFTADTKEITLADPSKAGYKFLGWYTDSGFKNKVTKISPKAGEDVTLYAKWEMETYTITYHLDGGTNASGNVTSYTIQSDRITLLDPTRKGYTFAGWYTDSGYSKKITTIDKGSYGDLDLYAKWEAIRYTITYHLNGGTNASGNPNSFTIDSKITLEDATKTGYKFLGWYTDSGFQNKITQIPKGTDSSLSLYAKWEAITYTITYDLNGGTINGTKITTFTIEDLPLTLPGAKKNGFVFLHWGLGSAVNGCVTEITTLDNYNLVACFMDPGLRLGLSDDGKFYRVLGYSGSATHLEIPAYYQNLPVQEIDGDAFDNSSYNNKVHSLQSIVLPGTIQVIEAYAFRDSDTLKSITFSDGLLEIEYSAFNDCDSLTSIILPDSVTTISSEAFYSCDNLKEVKLSNSLTYLGEGAFRWCDSLETINLPDSLKTMGKWIFHGCVSLESIAIPKSATTIPYGLCNGCTALSKVTLHSGVTTIESTAFEDCTSLVSIIIPESVTKIGSESFAGCTNITFYCEAEVTQSGWSSGWNNGCPVIYGYDPDSYEDPTYTFVTNGGSEVAPIKGLKVETKPVSIREDYALVGWYDNPDFTGDPVSFPYYSTSKTTLYAKWMLASEYYDGSSMERAYRLPFGTPVTIDFETKSEKIYFCFVPSYSVTYRVTSSEDTQIGCDLLDAEGKSLTWDSTMYGGSLDINYTMVAGQEYYLEVYPSCVGTWYDRTSTIMIDYEF